MHTRVLIVEEDELLAEFLRDRLTEDQFEVHLAGDSAHAQRLMEEQAHELLVLDLSLPGAEGPDLLRTARAKSPELAIIVLVPGGDPTHCVQGLDAGADDCLAKPFSYAELTARLRALLRRRASHGQAQLTVGDLVLDRIARTVRRGRHRIDLTEKEFALLEFLMERPCQPVTRALITEHAWELEEEKPTNLVAVYINYLRKKVDAGFEHPLIRTVRGVGYQIGEGDTSSN